MANKILKKTWNMPLLLASLTMFGLLSALLGTGIWYPLAWITMLAPIIVILWFWMKRR